MSGSNFQFSFGDSQDSYICGTPDKWKWAGIPKGLSTLLEKYATDILGVAIGLDGSYWVRYEDKDRGICRQWYGLPQHLEDNIKKEKPLEVSLGPNGSWFWSNGHKCKRSLHLPLLEAAIQSRLSEAPGTLKWVAMGKTSGVALFKDGPWRSHNAPAGLIKIMKGKAKGIDKIYLSPLDDIHYVVKWQDGSAAYCLPSDWSADLNSLIGDHPSVSGHFGGRVVTTEPCHCHVCDSLRLSKQGQTTSTSKSLRGRGAELNDASLSLRSDPIAHILPPKLDIHTQKATERNLNCDDRQPQHNRDFLQLIRQIAQGPVAPPNASVVAGLTGEYVDLATVHADDLPLGVSPQTDPIEWTRLNRKHVATIARLLPGQESIANTYKTNKLYPRLTLYTLASVMSNPYVPYETKYTKLSSTLQGLESWDTWDDITALAHHQTVRKYLLNCLKSINKFHDTRYDDPDRTTLGQVLKMDADAIDALLLATLQDRVKYRHLVKRRGQEAQSLLNLLQARLGFPLDASLKHLHVYALLKLSRTSGLYPECMTLKGIKLVGNAAIDGGGYGDIWKGLLNGQEIAVKVLRIFRKSDKDRLLKEFCSEAVLWRQLDHPNVLPFYGVFRLENDRLCFTSPWMNNGNIILFLQSAPETKCVPLMSDIAEGLNYLHTLRPRIIHGDIKGVNILITPSLRACLADFGLATTKDSQTFPITSAASTRAKGTLRWQAPELLDPEMDDASCANSFASDVYAYACVCYEIFSGRLPFHEITNDYRMMVAVREGKRPSRPSDSRCRIRGLDNEIWTIVQACWAQDPNCRPTAHQIVQQLRSSATRVVDERPVDHCDPSFPLRTLYSQAEHPFSALPGITNNDG